MLPWIIGFCAFFAYPFFRTVYLGFFTLDKTTLAETFVALLNFKKAFFSDVSFPQILSKSVLDGVQQVPLILMFSYFVALLLKKKFPFSGGVKAIFFLTVILSSDLYLKMQSQTSDLTNAQMQGALDTGGAVFQTFNMDSIMQSLYASGVPESMITFTANLISSISQIMLYSGIQIFIFLAGLNAISSSLYEAASIDGATPWESFWKITLPMTTPVIIVNLVYTIVDIFGSQRNAAMQYIYKQIYQKYEYGYASALSMVYMLIIGILLLIAFLLMRKRVFYQV